MAKSLDMKVTVIPMLVGALNKVPKDLKRKGLSELVICDNQTTAKLTADLIFIRTEKTCHSGSVKGNQYELVWKIRKL